MAFCKQCGIELNKTTQFCTKCGAKVDDLKRNAVYKQKKDKEADRKTTEAGVLDASAFARLPKADAIKLIIKTGAKALAKSLALSAAVLGPGFALLISGAVVLGMIWLFLGSFGLMAWSYRKPWRLGALSCLIPPVAAGFCYLAQLWLFGSAMPPFWVVLLAVVAGVSFGFVRGKAHEIYEKDGDVFAQRTVAYLGIWAACYGVTQIIGLIARETFVVQSGLVTGAFSTAMLAMVSISLFNRRHELKLAKASAIIMIASLGLGMLHLSPASAQAPDGAHAGDTLMDAVRKAPHASLPSAAGGDSQETRKLLADLFGGRASTSLGRERATWQRVLKEGATALKISVILELYGSSSAARPSRQSGEESKEVNYQTVLFYYDEGRSFARSRSSKGPYRIIVEAQQVSAEEPADDDIFGLGAAMEGLGPPIFSMIPLVLLQQELDPNFIGENSDTSTAPETRNDETGSDNVPSASDFFDNSEPENQTETPSEETLESQEPDSTPTYDSDPSPSYEFPSDAYQSWYPPGAEAAGVAAAVIAGILLAAGIVINVGQSLGAAMAAAARAGIEITSREVSDAMGNRNWDVAPPKIYDPSDGTAFETNADGRYWAPDDKGNWRWLTEVEAREAAAALRAEMLARGQEIAEHQRETEKMLETSRKQTQARYAAEHAAEAQASLADEAERKRRDALFEGIDKTLRGLPEDARYHAGMAELYDAQERGDTQMLNELWEEFSGDRQSQIRQSEDASAVYQRQAAGLGALESTATGVRDLSKMAMAAGLGTVTGGGATLLEAGIVGATGMGGLIAEGALEHGLKVKDGQVEFDDAAAMKGAARGARTGIGALVGGVPANGNAAVALGKVGFATTSDAAQTYADIHDKTGDREIAAQMAQKAFGISMAQNAMGEAWDESSRLAGQRAQASDIAEGLHTKASNEPTWAGAIAQNKQMMAAAGKEATDFAAGVTTEMAINDKDFTTAVTDTAKGTALKKAAGKLVQSTTPAEHGPSDAQRGVIDKLQKERLESGIAKSVQTVEGVSSLDNSKALPKLQPDGDASSTSTETTQRPAASTSDAEDMPSQTGAKQRSLFGQNDKETPTTQHASQNDSQARTPGDSDQHPSSSHSTQTPADKEAEASAVVREKQSKVWQAEQKAKDGKDATVADPDDTWKGIQARAADRELSDAEGELFKSEIEAQEATEAARGVSAQNDQVDPSKHEIETLSSDATGSKITKKDILDVPREQLDPTLQKVQDHLKKHGDFPEARGDEPTDPPVLSTTGDGDTTAPVAETSAGTPQLSSKEVRELYDQKMDELAGKRIASSKSVREEAERLLAEKSEQGGAAHEPQMSSKAVREAADQKIAELKDAEASSQPAAPPPPGEQPDIGSEQPPGQTVAAQHVPPSPPSQPQIIPSVERPDDDFFKATADSLNTAIQARDAVNDLQHNPSNPELQARAVESIDRARARLADLKAAAVEEDNRVAQIMEADQGDPNNIDLPFDVHRRENVRRGFVEESVRDLEGMVQETSDRHGDIERGAVHLPASKDLREEFDRRMQQKKVADDIFQRSDEIREISRRETKQASAIDIEESAQQASAYESSSQPQGLSDDSGAQQIAKSEKPVENPEQAGSAEPSPPPSSVEPPAEPDPIPTQSHSDHSDIEKILADAEAKGQVDDLEILDPTKGENIPGSEGSGAILEQGGRGGSLEETNRREIWLDANGVRVVGSDNPEDGIPHKGYRIRIDPDSEEISVRFDENFEPAHRKGKREQVLVELADKIKAEMKAQQERLARIAEQNDALSKNDDS